jgi:hypothetical protein
MQVGAAGGGANQSVNNCASARRVDKLTQAMSPSVKSSEGARRMIVPADCRIDTLGMNAKFTPIDLS